MSGDDRDIRPPRAVTDAAAARHVERHGAEDAAWAALTDRLAPFSDAPYAQVRDAIDLHRPAIEAAIRAAHPGILAGPGLRAPEQAMDARLEEFVEYRLGLYILAAEKLGQTAEDAHAVIADRDPYLAGALAALRAAPEPGLRAWVEKFVTLHDEDDGAGWPCNGRCRSVRELRAALAARTPTEDPDA